MDGLQFELARREHAVAIDEIRGRAGDDLRARLGEGGWGRGGKVRSITDRIKNADPQDLRGSTIYVATKDGVVFGTLVVSTNPPGFWKKSVWSAPGSRALGVFAMAVDPKWQRQGVGRFLMECVEQLALEHEIQYVHLDAYSKNPFSTAFYRSIGYEERGEIDLRGTGLILFEKAL